MPIIGKLVKKASEITYRRTKHRGLDFNVQKKSLRKLLSFAQNTDFGCKYGFSDMLDHPDIVTAFQNTVPITDYDKFYEEWLRRSIAGEKNVSWPGAVKYFALSSGTTGSPSKRIPVTKQMIRSFQKTTILQFSSIAELDFPEEFFQKSFLAVGGSTRLVSVDNHIEGDLSGILKKHTSIVLSPLTKPDRETAEIRNWNEKVEKLVEMAPQWDISTIAGIPSWCIMLMEKIVERYGKNNIHEIWPNLEMYMSGGVYVEPYLSRLHKVIGRPIHLMNTYLASEGYIAYQSRPDSQGMRMLLGTGIFFEFIPFDSDNFDESGNVRSTAKALTIEQVEEGIDYALLLSTNAGLWRYMIGDLVQFTDRELREIKISGRIKQYLSLTGEHLSLDNINVAIQRASNELGVDIPEFCLFPDAEKQLHKWYFGTDKPINGEQVMETVDRILGDLNDDYKAVRKYDNLHKPISITIPMQLFYDFMGEKGKLGSQNKFPRVMNAVQAKDWVDFIEKTSTTA